MRVAREVMGRVELHVSTVTPFHDMVTALREGDDAAILRVGEFLFSVAELDQVAVMTHAELLVAVLDLTDAERAALAEALERRGREHAEHSAELLQYAAKAGR